MVFDEGTELGCVELFSDVVDLSGCGVEQVDGGVGSCSSLVSVTPQRCHLKVWCWLLVVRWSRVLIRP